MLAWKQTKAYPDKTCEAGTSFYNQDDSLSSAARRKKAAQRTAPGDQGAADGARRRFRDLLRV